MIRLLLGALVRLAANSLGLVVAAVALDDMTLTTPAFVVGVMTFTIVEVVAEPLITKIAQNNLPALRGSVALISTLIGLIVTTLTTEGLDISGAGTWVLATLIVWAAALVASLVLPLVVVKRVVRSRTDAA